MSPLLAHAQCMPDLSSPTLQGLRSDVSSSECPAGQRSQERIPGHATLFLCRLWHLSSTGCPSSTTSSILWRSTSQSLLSSTTRSTWCRSPPSSTTLTSGKWGPLPQAVFGDLTQVGVAEDKVSEIRRRGWLLGETARDILVRFISWPFCRSVL